MKSACRSGINKNRNFSTKRSLMPTVLCRRGGFQKIRFRGDTDFSQTQYLDGWDEEGITFVFGMNAMGNLVERAENLSETAWDGLIRPPKYVIETEPRRKPVNVKEQIVKERGQ